MSSLDAVIPVLRQLILSELLVRESRPLYRVELARKLGVPPSSLQRPLQAMAQTGLLRARRHGREVHYEVDPDNPLIPELRSLLRKSRGLLDVLRSAVEPFAGRTRIAFVYGSMAAGTERPSSDVDLMVIGDVTLAELSPSLHRAEEVLGRPVNAKLYSLATLRDMALKRNHFLLAVLDKPKLFLVGAQDELEGLVGGRPAGDARDDRRGTRGASSRNRAKPR